MARKRKKSTNHRTSVLKVKGRKNSSCRRGKVVMRSFNHYVLPLAIMCVLLGFVMFMAFSGYRTATASGFFGLRKIEILGTERSSQEDIRRVVAAMVEKPGVWNADLGELRTKIEKFPFVKSASVSQKLPAGIRVAVVERIPAAIVQLTNGNYLVDTEGAILAAATANDKAFPFVLQGWDETKTEKTAPENLARLKMYKQMLDEWKQFDLASRVKEVNLANPREPVAFIEDSGREIAITVAKDSLGKSLKTAIEAVSGKGARIKSVDADGIYPVIQYLEF